MDSVGNGSPSSPSSSCSLSSSMGSTSSATSPPSISIAWNHSRRSSCSRKDKYESSAVSGGQGQHFPRRLCSDTTHRGNSWQINANPARVVTFVTSVRLAQKNCLAEPASLTSHSKPAVIEDLLDEPFLFNSEPFTVTTMDPSMTTHSFACKRYCL